MMKIAICGAPGSGKTTFAARLYANLLENGLYSTKLITEYAQDYLGAGNKIESIFDQEDITYEQRMRERKAITSNYNPLICDSPVWIGGIYLDYNTPEEKKKDPYFKIIRDRALSTVNEYTFTIFVPLFDRDKNQMNTHRMHGISDSLILEEKIIKFVSVNVDPQECYSVSKKLESRNKDIDILTHFIIDNLT